MTKKKLAWLLPLLSLVLVAIAWLPFLLKINFWGIDFSQGLNVLWSNFDGPNYLIIAKTVYDKTTIAQTFSNPLPLEYYPAHWPLYPAMIALVDLVLPGPWAMLGIAILGLAFFYWALVKFLDAFGTNKKQILWIGLTSLVLPARWLALRSVGSPEAWFLAFILLSLTAYKKDKHWSAGIWGALAQATKSPGILLFSAYGVYELIKLIKKETKLKNSFFNLLKVSLIPLTVLAVFGLYYLRTGDFLAYFNSGDNFHLFWPPFSIFSKGQTWVGEFWLEDVIWIWLVYGLGIVRLWKEKKELPAVFAGIFFLTTLFISHRDISRYIMPVMPMMLLGWQKELTKPYMKWILLLLIVPTLLFSWNFILNNMAPVADWTPYL